MDKKMREAYLAGMRACGFKVGDKVKVVFIPYKPDMASDAGGWGVYWGRCMSDNAGKTLTVSEMAPVCIGLSDGCYYPWFCLEKVTDAAPEEKSEATCPLKEGDLVIVRDADNQLWAGVRFIKYDPSRSCPHLCTPGIWWKHCLPLAGNEHLIGTADSPSSAPESVAEEKKPSQPFAPFTKVLVRDSDTENWSVNFYGYFLPGDYWPHRCVGTCYCQCISYEGNEHLLGTANSPE